MNKLKILLLLSLVAGCAGVPPSNIHQPMSARPAAAPTPPADGAIYHAQNARPLFEDRRARHVGDTLIISLVEKTTANSKSSSSASKTGSATGSISPTTGLGIKVNQLMTLNGSVSDKSAGSGASASASDFTGTITVTVIEELANGNLLVSGEKQVYVNQASEFIRFSGVVNPANIVNGTAGSTVQSTQVADARIEYREGGYIGEAQAMGWLGRFFLSVLPF